MNYSEPLISQVTVFCRAVGSGIILGVLYDVISFVRMLFGERKSVYVFFDTVYFLFASVISFFFMVLYNSGQVRLNLMLAELFGGVAFHFSFGKYILQKCALHLERIRKLFSLLLRPFVKTAGKLCSFFKNQLSSARKKVTERKNAEKIKKNF